MHKDNTHARQRRANTSASLATLAAHLGLSKASISRVLTRAPAASSIPAATQERIITAAREFNYRPNLLARSLRSGRSHTVGVIVPELSEGYSTLVLAGLEQTLSDAGFAMMLVTHHHRQTVLDDTHHIFKERAVDGIVAVDTTLPCAADIPTVTVSCSAPHANVTNIVLDHDHAAELAISHLHSLGHRSIAVIKGQAFSSDTEPRWRSIVRAAHRLDLLLPPDLVEQMQENLATDEPGFRAAQRLLAKGKRFTALLAFNDLSAIGAVRAMKAKDLDVPNDVSVVGFDDISLSSHLRPALTTIRQPLHEMGVLAAETILSRIAKAEDPYPTNVTLVVQPTLILRASTAPSPMKPTG